MALNPALRGLTDEINSRFVFAGLALVLSLMLALQLQAFGELMGKNTFSVNISVQKPSENLTDQITVRNGSTAFSALNSTYSVQYRKSSMGYFVTSVDGLASNKTHYWMYFVDGKSPQVSAGQYILEPGDDIVFRYLSLSNSRKYVQ